MRRSDKWGDVTNEAMWQMRRCDKWGGAINEAVQCPSGKLCQKEKRKVHADMCVCMCMWSCVFVCKGSCIQVPVGLMLCVRALLHGQLPTCSWQGGNWYCKRNYFCYVWDTLLEMCCIFDGCLCAVYCHMHTRWWNTHTHTHTHTRFDVHSKNHRIRTWHVRIIST